MTLTVSLQFVEWNYNGIFINRFYYSVVFLFVLYHKTLLDKSLNMKPDFNNNNSLRPVTILFENVTYMYQKDTKSQAKISKYRSVLPPCQKKEKTISSTVEHKTFTVITRCSSRYNKIFSLYYNIQTYNITIINFCCYNNIYFVMTW